MSYTRLPFEEYFTITKHVDYISVPYTWLGKKEWSAEYAVNYDESRNVIQLNFESTSGKMDWIANFIFVSKYYKSFDWDNPDTKKTQRIQLRVPAGWNKMYQVMKYQVREKFIELFKAHPDAEVEVIGWSLGSGMAMLCCQDLYYNYGIQSHVFTYGSTNPFYMHWFNKKKVMNYLHHCYKECYNFYDINDIVGYVPFEIWGYHKMNAVKVALEKFKFKNLFNPRKFHCSYDVKTLYTDIK